MRETGSTPASFGEVRNRADTIVLIGDGPREREPELLEKLFEAESLPRPGDNKRELIVVGAKKGETPKGVRAVELDGKHTLPELVALLAAATRELPFELRDAALGKKVLSAGKRLRNSAFAVFVYDPAELEEPVLHTVLETVRYLVKSTRAATLSMSAPGNGEGVNLCSIWTCGLPIRTSFAGDAPENNMWAFEAERLLKSGEADALVWIDALDGAEASLPTRTFRGIPAVVLSSKPVKAGRDDVVIEVGTAAADHDAEIYLPPIAGIGVVKAASGASKKPTVAQVLKKIGALIDKKGAA
jgi:formylmethanofuran dehydrogenase subunit B